MSTYSLKTQASYLFLGKIVAFCIASASPIILVRLITADQYGVYRQILFISTIVLALTQLMIPKSLYYFFPRTKGSHGKLLSQTLSILILVGFVGAIIFWILGRYFSLLPSGVTGEYVFPIAVYILFESVAYILDHLFILEKKSRLVFLLSITSATFRLSFVMGAILLFKSIIGIVYALIIFSAVRLAVLLVYLMKSYVIKFGILDKKLLNNQIKYIAPLAASSIIAVVGLNIDKGVISALMSPKDFAIYTIGGLGVMSAVTLVYTSVGNVCVPRFGELATDDDLEGIRRLWYKMIITNTIMTIPLVLFCFTFAVQIITILFTEQYIFSANILRINLLILLIQIVGWGYIPMALGKTKAILAGNIVRFFVSIPLSFLLITKMGLLGGAISFVIGFWINAIIQLYATKKALKVSVKKVLPWRKMFSIFIISVIPTFYLRYLTKLDIPSVMVLLVGALVYFPIVAITFKILGYINMSSIKTVLKPTIS